MRRLVAATLSLACVTSRPPRAAAPAPPRSAARAPAACPETLRSLAASLVGPAATARERSRALGLTLADARGATNLVGDAEVDDAVRGASVATSVGDTGALLVTTRCGNATLLSLRCDGAWRAEARVALVEGARPGACRLTEARSEAVGVFDGEGREVLVAWSSERDDGDSDRATTFSAFRLGVDGALADLTGPVPFGGEDDATGVGVRGRWFVIDALPPPRDVVLELRPSHPGVDGVALTRIERQVWRPVSGRLRRVVQESEAVAPRAGGSAPRLAPAP